MKNLSCYLNEMFKNTPFDTIEKLHLAKGFTCSDEFWKTFHGKKEMSKGVYIYSDEDKYKVHRNVLIVKSVTNGKWYIVMKNLQGGYMCVKTLEEAIDAAKDMLAYPEYLNKPEIGCDCNCNAIS